MLPILMALHILHTIPPCLLFFGCTSSPPRQQVPWGGKKNSTSRFAQISKAWTINHETVSITPKTFYRRWLHQTQWKPRARYVFLNTAQSLSLPIPPRILTNQIHIPPPPPVTLDPRTRWQNMETSVQMHTPADTKSSATSYKTFDYAAGQVRARVCFLFCKFLPMKGSQADSFLWSPCLVSKVPSNRLKTNTDSKRKRSKSMQIQYPENNLLTLSRKIGAESCHSRAKSICALDQIDAQIQHPRTILSAI